jgi:hypothetical protein
MRKTFKDNLFIILGITLPLFLILIVLVIRSFNSWAVQDPAYIIAYTSNHEPDIFHSHYDQDMGTLKLVYAREKDKSYFRASDKFVLNLFHAAKPIELKKNQINMSNWDIDYNRLKDGRHIKLVFRPKDYKENQYTTDLEFLKNYRFHRNRKAPDGYVFRRREHDDHDAFTDIFSSNYIDSDYLIQKQTRKIPVPNDNYRDVDFIAWLERGSQP